MRKDIYRIVSRAQLGDRQSRAYDLAIMIISVVSVVPLAFRTYPAHLEGAMNLLELLCVYVLFLDYILRWMTYDYRRGKSGALSFVIYPITPLAIIDLVALLPSLGLLPATFKILRLLRLVKLLTYSRSCGHIVKVFEKEKKTLGSVLVIAVAYIFVSALIMFQHEPASTFEDFFDALYWATTALTTVGYGDVYPHTDIGKLISMISSLFGVAIIAMPASIVTAGIIDAMQEEQEEEKQVKQQPMQQVGQQVEQEVATDGK